MPASYYRVSSKLWAEPWDETTRYFALYLLTCPHRTTEGLFRLPLGYAQEDLGWPPRKVRDCIEKLAESGFLKYDEATSVVLLPKALKYQSPQNPNQVTAAVKALETVPPSVLDAEFGRLAQLFAQRLAQQLPQRFGHSQSHTQALSQSPPTPRKRGGRANGTSPRQTAWKAEIERYEGLISSCPNCGSNPNVDCASCSLMRRKVGELQNQIRELASA